MARALSRLRRWRRRFFAVALLAGLLAVLALLRAPPERFTDARGARVQVIDGDSLRIANRILRLEGIDAVELHQLCREAGGGQWSCGFEARAALEEMVAQGGLRCESRGGDRYGRAIARCSASSVSDIGADLVAQGWAVSGDGRGNGRYQAQQAGAQAARRGIWRGTFERPALWRAAHPRSDGA